MRIRSRSRKRKRRREAVHHLLPNLSRRIRKSHRVLRLLPHRLAKSLHQVTSPSLPPHPERLLSPSLNLQRSLRRRKRISNLRRSLKRKRKINSLRRSQKRRRRINSLLKNLKRRRKINSLLKNLKRRKKINSLPRNLKRRRRRTHSRNVLNSYKTIRYSSSAYSIMECHRLRNRLSRMSRNLLHPSRKNLSRLKSLRQSRRNLSQLRSLLPSRRNLSLPKSHLQSRRNLNLPKSLLPSRRNLSQLKSLRQSQMTKNQMTNHPVNPSILANNMYQSLMCTGTV